MKRRISRAEKPKRKVGRPAITDQRIRKLHGLGPVPRRPKAPEQPPQPQRADAGLCPDRDSAWCTPDDCTLCPSWNLRPDGDGGKWPSLRSNWPKGWPEKVSREKLAAWLKAHCDGVALVPGQFTRDGSCPDRGVEPWCNPDSCEGCPSLACKPTKKRGPWIRLRHSRRWPASWPVNRALSFDAMKKWLDSRR